MKTVLLTLLAMLSYATERVVEISVSDTTTVVEWGTGGDYEVVSNMAILTATSNCAKYSINGMEVIIHSDIANGQTGTFPVMYTGDNGKTFSAYEFPIGMDRLSYKPSSYVNPDIEEHGTYYWTSYQNDYSNWNDTVNFFLDFWGDRKVVVAIIDDGFNVQQIEDLGQLWVNRFEIPGNGIDDDGNGFVDDVNGWDFRMGDNDVNYANSAYDHGREVWASGFSLYGQAPGVTIMPLKIASDTGLYSNIWLPRAIIYAVLHGADVINLSLERIVDEQYEIYDLNAAIEFARDNNVLVIHSAGNSATLSYPSSSSVFTGDNDCVLTVGATQGSVAPYDRRLYTTCIDPRVEISAMGYSCQPYYSSGTSFAAPQVAAAAALLRSADPEKYSTWQELKAGVLRLTRANEAGLEAPVLDFTNFAVEVGMAGNG